MPRIGRGTLLLTSLACLCLSSARDNNDRKVYIGPLLGGEEIDVQLRFFVGDYGAEAVVYFDARGNGLPYSPIGLSQQRISEMEVDEKGYATFIASLAGFYVKAGENIAIELGICAIPYYRGIDWGKRLFVCYETFQIKRGSRLFQIDEEGIFETQNEVFRFDEATDYIGIDHDSYEAHGLISGQNFAGRRIPIEDLYVDYFGYGAKPKKRPAGEIRLLNYQSDFSEIATSRGGYSSIPLEVSCVKSGDAYRYKVTLAEEYSYSRIDLKAYKEPPLKEPYFPSKAFFLPLREKHDSRLYRFQIVLDDVGAFGETLVINMSASSTRSFFGNCFDSEYCVVAGGAI